MQNKSTRVMIALFVIPSVIAFLIIFAYPVIRTILMSFFAMNNVSGKISEWEFVGFGNYITLFNSLLFKTSIINMAKIWVFGGIIVSTFALTFAVILTSGIRFKSFFRSAIYLPNIISAVAMASMWINYAFNAQFGLFKNMFTMLGMERMAAIPWTSPDYLFYAMLIAYCYGSVGYFMLIFIAGIEKIPVDIYESASIEGANIFKKFAHITIPLLSSVFRTALTLWTTGCLGFFVWSQMFSPGTDPDPGTVTPIVYMYRSVFGGAGYVDTSTLNAGEGAAVCVIIMIMAIFAFTLINKIIKDKKLEF